MPVCKLCNKDIDSLYHITEQFMLDMIQRDHPDWVEKDGACLPCVEYYKDLDDAVRVEGDESD